MSKSFRNRLSTFSPAETAAITGISVDMQRDWRRRGFLISKGEGWTEFDTFDLATLQIMRAMQNRGIGPAISSPLANSMALRIVFYATCWTDAVEDNEAGREVKRMCQESGRPLGSIFANWTNGGGPQRFLVVWPDNNFSFADDLKKAFGESSSDPRYHGAVLVFDLEALGSQLLEKAGRPLAAIDIVDEDDEKKRPEYHARKRRFEEQKRRTEERSKPKKS